MMFLIVTVLFIVWSTFMFCFLRSSKEMPRNWREFKFELIFQYYGVIGYLEDLLTSFKNKVEIVKRQNRVVVMTGGNRGIGVCVLEKLLKCDMIVMLGVRNPDESRKVVEETLGAELTKEKVFYEKCDTGDMESVQEFAKTIQQKFHAVHVLINNAGVMCTPYKLTRDGFESQMAINYLGHFLLTHLLMPQLIAGTKCNDGSNVRIVNVSSCVHNIVDIDYDDFHCENFYYPADSYSKSKLAQVLFTMSLDRLCREKHLKIRVLAVHPGIVNTDLFKNSNSDYFPWMKKFLYKTPEQGSRVIVYAATSPKQEDKGGSYLTNCIKLWHHKSANNDDELTKLFEFTCDLLNIKDFGSLNAEV